jgi:hypothetical protein
MPVPQNPTIRLYFTGLLAFCFDKRRKQCQIGVHSKTDDHELRLRFVKKGPDPENESEQTLTISHALIRQASDLWLDVEGELAPKQSTAEPFIAGRRDEPPTDPQDFRRVVDLEGEYFYNRPLKVRRGVLKPILFVAKGLFYTATLSSDSYQAVPFASNRAVGAIAANRNLGHIAEYIGANIYLTHPNQALVLRVGRNGSELLRLKSEEGITYEITIENGDTLQAPAGSDFHYYYDAIKLNRNDPRILLETYGLPSFGGGMGEICGCVWLGKSNGLVFG